MFYKLRLKLTLINTTVIFLLFVLLISGTYYYSHVEINRHAQEFAHRILRDIQSGRILDLPLRHESEHQKMRPQKDAPSPPPLTPPLPPPPGIAFFFVKTSEAANITFQSSSQPLSAETLILLVKNTLQDEKLEGFITLAGCEYYFLKASKDPDTIIIFHDFTQENNMLDIQLSGLIAVGIVCLVLSFIGSFFMANRALIPIQNAWQQQKDFLSDASHELRTPLAVMQTNLDIVMENKLESVASQEHWLQNLQEEVTQMATLVDSLLFLARADSHQQIITKQPFSFSTTVMRTVLPFKPVAAEKGISLKLMSAAPIDFIGDEARIKQVIGILLDNAIRHTPAGGNIKIELSQTASSIILAVADNGKGIPAEFLENIFHRFYQVDKARSNGRAGLGLAIAKWIIEAHDGTIEVTSLLGTGTTFTIVLPNN